MAETVAEKTQVKLVCPNCDSQQIYDLVDGTNDYACKDCNRPARALFGKVRSKRSRGDKKAQSRQYSVRVLHEGVEDLFEFSGGYHEFELRGGDHIILGYDQRDALCVVQNLTLARFERLTVAHRANYKPLIIGLVVLVVVIAIGAAFVAHSIYH